MDDQNLPPVPNRYEPNGTPPPVVQPEPIPTPHMAQEHLMQWEQNVSGPVNGSVGGPLSAPQSTTGSAPATLPEPGLPLAFAKKPRKKKGLFVGIISVAVLAVLGVAGVFAYTVWNQTPEKVIADSILNLLKAKTVSLTGTYNFESKTTSNNASAVKSVAPSSPLTKWKLIIDGKGTRVGAGEMNVTYSTTIKGKDISLKGSGMVATDGSLYVKIEKITELLQSQGADNGLIKAFQPLIKNIDGKWIKISTDDLKLLDSELPKKNTCVQDALKKIETDKAESNEIIDLYKNNSFIVIDQKLGVEKGSVGYRIKGDDQKYKSFIKGLNTTKLLKDLQKCDKKTYTLTPPATDKSTDKTKSETVEVWISEQKHELTKITASNDTKTEKYNFTVEPIFDVDVSIATPSKPILIKDLIQQIEQAYTAYAFDAYKAELKTTDTSSMSLEEDSTDTL
jgi:hypothetical protein